VSEGNALTADTALSHFDTSKNPAPKSVILYKFICLHNSARIIISYNFINCKSFLKFFYYFLHIFKSTSDKWEKALWEGLRSLLKVAL
jgi:hypothetical protein